MKRLMTILTCLLITHMQMHAHVDSDGMEFDYSEVQRNSGDDYIGAYGGNEESNSISVSMLGWGIGLAGLIAIIAGVFSSAPENNTITPLVVE